MSDEQGRVCSHATAGAHVDCTKCGEPFYFDCWDDETGQRHHTYRPSCNCLRLTAPASVPPVDPRKFKQRLEEVMRERGQTSYVEWDETTQQVVVHHLDGAKNEVDQP